MCAEQQIHICQHKHQILEDKQDAQVEEKHCRYAPSGKKQIATHTFNQKSKKPVAQNGADHDEHKPWFPPSVKEETCEQKKIVSCVSVAQENIIDQQNRWQKGKQKN